LCAEEAIVERCPNYRPEAEGSWSEEDAAAPTNPNDDGARFSVLEAIDYLRSQSREVQAVDGANQPADAIRSPSLAAMGVAAATVVPAA
jgi:hypothetical protein